MSLQVSDNILKQIKLNFAKQSQKIAEGLKYLEKDKDAPKAMAYLRFLGTELGYMKTTELNAIMQNIMMYSEIFFSILPIEVSISKITKNILKCFTTALCMVLFLNVVLNIISLFSPTSAAHEKTDIWNR